MLLKGKIKMAVKSNKAPKDPVLQLSTDQHSPVLKPYCDVTARKGTPALL